MSTILRLGLIWVFSSLIVDIQSLAILSAVSYVILGMLSVIIFRYEYKQLARIR